MNFLAHIYLSGDNKGLQLGNFIADSVKGNQFINFENTIKNGILLHRFIDYFTDNHIVYRKSKHRLHEKYGHYSGVIMDIFYDHFLAKNWKNYHPISLEIFADDFYTLLDKNMTILPEKIQNMIPVMKRGNWLVSYATLAGLKRILLQMDFRTQHRVNMQNAIFELQEFYSLFEEEFTLFFKELIAATSVKRLELM